LEAIRFASSDGVEVPGGARRAVFGGGRAADEATAAYDVLLRTVEWEQPAIHIAGQKRLIPRKQAWCGCSGAGFTYSGTRFDPVPFTQDITHLKQRVEEACQHPFNSVLANLYRDERDSVGWHADDEKEFGPNPIIASLSLGETRRFQFKPKPHHLKAARWQPRQKSISMDLRSGDLVLMGPDVQTNWFHCVPKETKSRAGRINLTFRQVVNAESGD